MSAMYGTNKMDGRYSLPILDMEYGDMAAELCKCYRVM